MTNTKLTYKTFSPRDKIAFLANLSKTLFRFPTNFVMKLRCKYQTVKQKILYFQQNLEILCTVATAQFLWQSCECLIAFIPYLIVP